MEVPAEQLTEKREKFQEMVNNHMKEPEKFPEITNDHLTTKEKEFLDAVKSGNIGIVKQLISSINVDCSEDDGMTALMFASYKGNVEIVEYLLENGASPNANSHKDGYTSLMFATLAGSLEVVRLLLEAGAKTDTINKVKRTAAQLGAFVGRHDCVSLINNFVEQDKIKYYTKKTGLQETPKLKEHLAGILHKYIMVPNLNPVRMVLFLEKNKELLTNHKSVIDVMETECQKAYKSVNEILSLKMHFLCCVLKKTVAWENGKEGKGGCEGYLKYLVKGRKEDGFLVNIEMVLRDAIKSFPYSSSNVFKQLVQVLSKVQIGNEPSALTAITNSLNGIQSADFSECCVCCGTRHSTNKCSQCKMVRYCGARCQKLHWSTHKLFCKDLKKVYEIQQEQKRREEEAKAQQVKLNEAKSNVHEAKADEADVKNLSIADEVENVSQKEDTSG